MPEHAVPSPAGRMRRRPLVALAAAAAVGVAMTQGTGAAGADPVAWLTGTAGRSDAAAAAVAAGDAVAIGGVVYDAIFGRGEANQTRLTNDGYGGAFFAAYGPDGQLAWAVADSGLGTWVTGVAIGPHGTVFGSGGAWDEICLKASATTVTCVRTSQDTSEIFIPFVVSFDARGFVRWMRTVDDSEGGLTGAGGSIAVDRRGRAIVADTYVGPITFGSGEPNATRLTGDAGLYVAQYRPDGRLGWAVRALGSFGGDQIAVVADPAANAVIAGTFVGRAVFAPDLPQQRVLDAVGERDAFIAKYDGAGRLLWARRLGGAGDERLGGLATDAEGRLFALIATDDRVAVSRFGPSGRLHLTRPLSGVATATAIAAGPDGTIAVTGSFRDGATFGAGEPTAVTLKAASGEGDAFVARYTGTGRFVSVVPIVGGGTPSRESPAGVAIDAGSRVIVAGDASSPIRVGRGTDARFWRYGLYGSIYLGTFAAPDAAPDAGTGAGTGGATAD